MKDLLQEIHQSPSNQNIRVKSNKHNLLEKFHDNQWVICDKNNTLDEMINKGYRILFQHFISNITDPNFKDREEYINIYFNKLVSQKDPVYYQLRRDLFVMIMNNTLYIVGR